MGFCDPYCIFFGIIISWHHSYLTQLCGVSTLGQSPVLEWDKIRVRFVNILPSKFRDIFSFLISNIILFILYKFYSLNVKLTWIPAPQLLEQTDQADQAPESEEGSQDRVSSIAAWRIKGKVNFRKPQEILFLMSAEFSNFVFWELRKAGSKFMGTPCWYTRAFMK